MCTAIDALTDIELEYWENPAIDEGTSLKDLLLRTQHVDMSDLENLALFLVKRVNYFPNLQIGISTFESAISTLQIGTNTYVGITVDGVLTTVDATDPTDATAVLNKLYNILRT